MKNEFKLLDTVALIKDVPEKKLRKGQVGTIVEQFNDDTFEIEFCNRQGETLCITAVSSVNLLLLRYDLLAA